MPETHLTIWPNTVVSLIYFAWLRFIFNKLISKMKLGKILNNITFLFIYLYESNKNKMK